MANAQVEVRQSDNDPRVAPSWANVGVHVADSGRFRVPVTALALVRRRTYRSQPCRLRPIKRTQHSLTQPGRDSETTESFGGDQPDNRCQGRGTLSRAMDRERDFESAIKARSYCHNRR